MAAQVAESQIPAAQHTDASAVTQGTHHTVTSLMHELHAKEQHLEELKCRVAEAEAALQAKKDLLDVIRSNNPISKDELVEVRTTIETQDKIIGALGKDNERLLAENRALTVRIRELEKIAADSEARSTLRSSQTSPAKDNHPYAGESVERLHATIDRYRTTEAELRLECDALRKAKRDFERRLTEIDASKVEEKELENRRLKVMLQRQQESKESEMQDMLRKVSWYVEHQEFNAAQEDLIKEQQQTVHKLRAKNLELEEALKVATGSTKITAQHGGNEKDRVIKQLQRQIYELEETIRTRNPNSIPELIRACRPSVREERTIRGLQEKIASLETQLIEQEANGQKVIDRLRIETDGLRTSYNKRLEKLEEEMKIKLLSAQTRKTKELEKTLADTRRFYTAKIKEQDEYVVALRRGLPFGLKESKQRGPQAKEPPKAVDASTAASEAKAAEPPQTPPTKKVPDQNNLPSLHAEPTQTSLLSTRLTEENAYLRRTIDVMHQQLQQVSYNSQIQHPTASAAVISQHVSQLQHELAMARRLLHEAQEASRQSMLDAEERTYRLRSAHSKEIERLKADNREEIDVLKRQHYNELAHRDESSRMFDVLGGVTVGGSMNTTQVRSYLEAVASRLRSVENQNRLREAQLKQSLEQVQKAAEYELAVEKQKMELLVRQKNCEIEAFRLQLDALLQDLAQLREPPVNEL